MKMFGFPTSGSTLSVLLELLGGVVGIVYHHIKKQPRPFSNTHSTQEIPQPNPEDYASLIEEASFGVYRTTLEGRFLAANPAMLDLLGYSDLSDLQALNAGQIFPNGDERKRWKELIEAEGFLVGFETQIRRQDGRLVWVENLSQLVRNREGQELYYEGILMDVNERKNAEAALRESEEKYRKQKALLERILEETPVGTAFLEGPEYRYTFANPAYLGLVRGKGNIIGRTVAEVWPEAIAELQPLLDRVYQTGEPFHSIDMPRTVLREDGPETAYLSLAYIPMMRPNGTVESLLVAEKESTQQVHVRQQLEKELSERKRMEAVLRESERRYLGLFEDSPVALIELDASGIKTYLDQLQRDGVTDLSAHLNERPEQVMKCMSQIRVIDVNQEAVNLYRAEDKTTLLANFKNIFIPENLPIFRHELQAINSNQRIFESEGKNRTFSGEAIDIHLRWSVAPGYEGNYSKVLVSILDITSRKKAEALAEKQAAQTNAMARMASELAAASLDAGAIYEIITAQTANLIGDACLLTLFSEDQEMMCVAASHHPDQEKAAQVREIMPSGWVRLEEGQVAQNAKPLLIPRLQKEGIAQIHEPGYRSYLDHFEVSSLLIVPLIAQGQVIGTLGVMRDQEGAAYALEDLSLLRYLANQSALPILNARLHERIKLQAQLDPLTGILNRGYFFELAEQEFLRAQRYRHDLAVIMIDVDHYKEINDTYGHEAGDQLLVQVAGQVRTCIRATDLFGRYGGDEFLILLPEINLAGAKALAERVCHTVRNTSIEIQDKQVEVTLSLGIAAKTDTTSDLAQLLRQADNAMYAAKRDGRNRVNEGS